MVDDDGLFCLIHSNGVKLDEGILALVKNLKRKLMSSYSLLAKAKNLTIVHYCPCIYYLNQIRQD